MSLSDLFWGGVVALFVGYFVLGLRKVKRLYSDLPTFEQYRRQHPDLVREGRCRCHSCSGHRIFVENLSPEHRRHICATCSTVLYRS